MSNLKLIFLLLFILSSIYGYTQKTLCGTILSDSTEPIFFAEIYILTDSIVSKSRTDNKGNFCFEENLMYPKFIYAEFMNCSTDTIVITSRLDEKELMFRSDCMKRIKYRSSKIIEELYLGAYYADISNLYSDFPIIKGDSIAKIENFDLGKYVRISPKMKYKDGKGLIKKGQELIDQKNLYLENWKYTNIRPDSKNMTK